MQDGLVWLLTFSFNLCLGVESFPAPYGNVVPSPAPTLALLLAESHQPTDAGPERTEFKTF